MNKNINVLLILQARGGSKRFPEKILKKIQNVPIIKIILQRVQRSKLVDKIVVATSVNRSSNKLYKLVKKEKELVEVYRGSERNVFSRFYDIGKKYKPKYIVRITGDCPFVNPHLIDKYIKFILNNKYDYVSNVIDRSFPKGLDVEVFKFSLLKKIYNSKLKLDLKTKEHVTSKMINGMNIKKYNFLIKENFSKINLSVDTLDDLKFVKKVYKKYGLQNYSVVQLLNILKNKKI